MDFNLMNIYVKQVYISVLRCFPVVTKPAFSLAQSCVNHLTHPSIFTMPNVYISESSKVKKLL